MTDVRTMVPPLTDEARWARRQSMDDLLHRSARRTPDKLALHFEGTDQTFAELDRAVSLVANALLSRGIRKGDRLAMLGHNSSDYVVAMLAACRVGAISVPINFMLHADEVAYILESSSPLAAFAEDALVPVMHDAIERAGLAAQVRLRIASGPGADRAGWEPFSALLAHGDEERPRVLVEDDDPIQLLYTSGTESRPKGAIMTSRNLVAGYASMALRGEMTPEDVDVHAMPLYHCGQLHCFLLPDLYLGASSILLPGPDPIGILSAIQDHRATKFFCPPTVWIALLRHPDFESYDISTLQKAYYGASVMPMAVLEELLERLPGVRIFNCYGQTEVGPVTTMLGPEHQFLKPGSCGLPTLNEETRIVDADGEPAEPGSVGEIVHRSSQLMGGYWNDPERTAEAFRGGWFHSGDLGRIDEDGFLYVVDRVKDMIKSGGENVASREVEEVVFQHPAVAEAAVIGLPDPHWVEAVTVVVVLRDGASLDEGDLIDFCRERLAGYKTPKRVVVADGLPKNASGKVLKRDLRERYADLADS